MDASLIAAAYDREADRYDARFEAQQRPKFAAVARLVAPPDDGSFVLDVGGGTGLLAGALTRIDPCWSEARFVVVDLSAAMLLRAATRANRAVLADARRLPFATGSFARVFCVTGLVVESHVERAIVSASRVLAADGTFALTLRAPLAELMTPDLLGHAGLELVAASDAQGDRVFVCRRLTARRPGGRRRE